MRFYQWTTTNIYDYFLFFFFFFSFICRCLRWDTERLHAHTRPLIWFCRLFWMGNGTRKNRQTMQKMWTIEQIGLGQRQKCNRNEATPNRNENDDDGCTLYNHGDIAVYFDVRRVIHFTLVQCQRISSMWFWCVLLFSRFCVIQFVRNRHT